MVERTDGPGTRQPGSALVLRLVGFLCVFDLQRSPHQHPPARPHHRLHLHHHHHDLLFARRRRRLCSTVLHSPTAASAVLLYAGFTTAALLRPTGAAHRRRRSTQTLVLIDDLHSFNQPLRLHFSVTSSHRTSTPSPPRHTLPFSLTPWRIPARTPTAVYRDESPYHDRRRSRFLRRGRRISRCNSDGRCRRSA